MKRAKIIPILFIFGFLIIIARLYQIQIISTRAFSENKTDLVTQAEQIYSREILLDSGRGLILDRNGKPLAGDSVWQLLVFPQTQQQLALRREQLGHVSEVLGIRQSEWVHFLSTIKQPTVIARLQKKNLILSIEQAKQINQLKIPGVEAVQTDHRLGYGQTAGNVLGRIGRSPYLLKTKYQKEVDEGLYTTQSRVGLSGLEASFERFLHGEEEDIITYVRDGKGKAMIGAKLKWKEKAGSASASKNTIVTTLDRDIQEKVEEILADEQVVEGAVVVQEIQSGNLLVLASRPIDGTAVVKEPWNHRAWMEATPGSIFKIVTTIAALDQGLVTPETIYRCDGMLDKYQLSEPNEKGHGKQKFSNQFADSCNIVLGSLAEKLGSTKLEEYAKRLGLGQKVIWNGMTPKTLNFQQIEQEQSGFIVSNEEAKNDQGVAVRTGIGQQSTKVTPIQAANLVTSLFHKGRPIEPRIVTEVKEIRGKTVVSFVNKYLPNSKPIKESVLLSVRKMMRQVVTEGTGKSLSKAQWPLAAKTGTAQIGVHNNQYNKWMIGFGPYQKPLYSVSVVIRNVSDSNDIRVQRIFRKVMDALYEVEKSKKKAHKSLK